MGAVKSDLYSDYQSEIAAYAKVMGHPARVAILEHLFKIDRCVCGDLVKEVGLSQPTISQHLKELKHLGLIKGTIEGTRVCYCIDAENWVNMKTKIRQFLDRDIEQQECC